MNEEGRARPGGLFAEVGLGEQDGLGSCLHAYSGGTEGGVDGSVLTVSPRQLLGHLGCSAIAGREMHKTPLLGPHLVPICVLGVQCGFSHAFPPTEGKLARFLQDQHGVASVKPVAQRLSA